jgi:hypothetical protein
MGPVAHLILDRTAPVVLGKTLRSGCLLRLNVRLSPFLFCPVSFPSARNSLANHSTIRTLAGIPPRLRWVGLRAARRGRQRCPLGGGSWLRRRLLRLGGSSGKPQFSLRADLGIDFLLRNHNQASNIVEVFSVVGNQWNRMPDGASCDPKVVIRDYATLAEPCLQVAIGPANSVIVWHNDNRPEACL